MAIIEHERDAALIATVRAQLARYRALTGRGHDDQAGVYLRGGDLARLADLAAEALTLRGLLTECLDWLGTYQCQDQDEGDDLIDIERRITAALAAHVAARQGPGKAGGEGD